MGDYFQIIVDRDATPEEAEPLANRIRDWLVKQRIIQAKLTDCLLGGVGHPPGSRFFQALRKPDPEPLLNGVNGLEIVLGRTVFWNVGWEYICRKCGAKFDTNADKQESGKSSFIDAVDSWFAGDDAASCPCPGCGHVELLTDWDGPWPWGFGYLGFKFWNWPELSPKFILEMTMRLGHRTRLVAGKL